jgi:hypothetical protein
MSKVAGIFWGGKKKIRKGTQGAFHMDKEEDEWILWQAPWPIRRWDLRMSFPSQEANEWEKWERKELEGRYLPRN